MPEVFDEDLELMPKEWHDGRSAPIPDKKADNSEAEMYINGACAFRAYQNWD
jgi:hypothetical protein